jgi:hypothetical protein
MIKIIMRQEANLKNNFRFSAGPFEFYLTNEL